MYRPSAGVNFRRVLSGILYHYRVGVGVHTGAKVSRSGKEGRHVLTERQQMIALILESVKNCML
jgi:hypothetical protein